MIKRITSIQNSFIKQLLLLKEKSRERKQKGLFLIEGQRELLLALKGHYVLEHILVCQEVFCSTTLLDDKLLQQHNVIEISKPVYHKLAHRDTTEGIIAVAQAKSFNLSNICFNTSNPLILIAEAIEKPGNIGALLRTADAANVDAFIIANPKTDIYNPNIIRSSVGCSFTVPLATGTTNEVIDFLNKNKIQMYCASLQNAVPYHEANLNIPCAIIVGTEATGLSKAWRTPLAKHIVIPMQGKIDSMNVSVAAGILTFEAKRQRQFTQT